MAVPAWVGALIGGFIVFLASSSILKKEMLTRKQTFRVLMTPQEMLPSFFVNFIRPWVPIRFASEGLREIFYFGSGFYTGQSFNTVLGIGIAGLVIFLLSIFKPVRAQATKAE
ncbi:hypothetical protein [Paenibacillus polymyxa]|uniref:hypothetical protein n=2 Tax=Paenibacillus TaxID=44249 RepID=UPI00287F9A39|nr:hypothetical protein [Paenibacillus polymyxa]